MIVKICDMENSKLIRTIQTNGDGTFLCPNCKEQHLKLERYYYKKDDFNAFTFRCTCSYCAHTYYGL